MSKIYEIYFASLPTGSRLEAVAAYPDAAIDAPRSLEFFTGKNPFTNEFQWIKKSLHKFFPEELQDDLKIPRSIEAAKRLNNWLRVPTQFAPFLNTGDVLIFLVTTSQLPAFEEFCKTQSLDKQKKYTLPPARNRNYPSRVDNPDKGFCLHTFVFQITEEGFNHA